MAICYLGIGSNLGNRRKNIELALKEINQLKRTKVIKTSSLIETIASGGPLNQGKFLNAALRIKTNLSPFALLKALKTIEYKLGRPKKYIRFGPRVIDLDILFYADKAISYSILKVPHLRAFKRDFVMRPLLEIL